MLALLTCADSAHAGIEIDFSGTVSQFTDFIVTPHSSGSPTTTEDVSTDIVPGTSTFEGTVFLPDQLTVASLHSPTGRDYNPTPLITVTVAHEFTFRSDVSEPFSTLNLVGVSDSENGTYEFTMSHVVNHVGLFGALADLEATGLSVASLTDPIEQRIATDLSAFQRGYFIYSFRDFLDNSGIRFFPNGVGHDIEVLGPVTSLRVITPEPSTLVSASIAGLIGLGLAWRRRKAKLAF